MDSNSNSSTDSPSGGRRQFGRSGKLAVLIVVLYAVLTGGLCWGGIVGHVFYVGLVAARFLAVYAVGPLAVVLWAAFMMTKGKGPVVRSGLKSAVIIFGLLGLALWTVATIPPNARAVSAGFWIRAKLGVDTGQIRSWAAARQPSADRFEPVDRDQWPESLRSLSPRGGTVTYDPKTHAVIFYQEGRYFRWGLTVAAPGAPPPKRQKRHRTGRRSLGLGRVAGGGITRRRRAFCELCGAVRCGDKASA